MSFHPHLLQDVDVELLERAVAAVQVFQATAIPTGESYQGISAEQILRDAGLSEGEQVLYMGLVCDKIRHDRGEAPDDPSRTTCHWCGRGFETRSGRGIHERTCRERAARNRRIVHAFLVQGRDPAEIAEAEGVHWRTVYHALREEGVDVREDAA